MVKRTRLGAGQPRKVHVLGPGHGPRIDMVTRPRPRRFALRPLARSGPECHCQLPAPSETCRWSYADCRHLPTAARPPTHPIISHPGSQNSRISAQADKSRRCHGPMSWISLFLCNSKTNKTRLTQFALLYRAVDQTVLLSLSFSSFLVVASIPADLGFRHSASLSGIAREDGRPCY